MTGPTSCGKSTFVKDVLKDNRRLILPQIQRIIWLYKRWQPLYNEIQQSVMPRVEFIQGIPENIQSDDFIQPHKRNLIVIDDLANECMDSRINDLFTVGSHHRNLSVILLNQNLYHNRSPTQRRNCHYLVIFNNPIDKQSVMTLARQMYPGKSDYFMNMFARATKFPYGYLLLDLKQETAEGNRLRPNAIKESEHVTPHYLATGHPTEHIDEPIIMDHTACDDCGLLFDNVHDLQRHVKKWCYEKASKPGETPMEVTKPDEPPMTMKTELPVFDALMASAREENEDQWAKKVAKYISQGMEETDASDKANQKLRQEDIAVFMREYRTLLYKLLQLQDGLLHNKIIKTVNELLKRGYSKKEAIQLGVAQFKSEFEELYESM